jgi:hypothetical protein
MLLLRTDTATLILWWFTLLLRFLEKRSWYQAWFWCPSPPSWSGSCGGLVLLDLDRLHSLLPSFSSFLAALLLLLISLWWSSKWPWSLVDWAEIFVVISGMVLSVLEVRWMVKWCWWVWGAAACAGCVFIYFYCCVDSTGYACGDCAASGGQVGFLYLWRQATVVSCLSWLVTSFDVATCISGCANVTDLAK